MYSLKCTDEEARLIELLSLDSEYAFQKLYSAHYDRIFKLAMRYFSSTEIAEEIVQEVFMKLWLQRKVVKAGGPIEGWLFTVAKNNIINKHKKQANEWKIINQLKNIQPQEDDSMQDKIRDADYQILLKGALNCLSEMQLQVFNLAKKENLSYIEIAACLDISPLTVKTHMSRALGHIRSVLTPQRLYS